MALTIVALLGMGVALSGCNWNEDGTSGTSPASVADAAKPPTSGTASLTLSWDAPTVNTDGSSLSNLKGYKVYYGAKSAVYTSVVDIPNPGLTTYVVQDLNAGTYYFALAAYNSQGVESGLTPEVSVAVD
jgi:hypothetical protein